MTRVSFAVRLGAAALAVGLGAGTLFAARTVEAQPAAAQMPGHTMPAGMMHGPMMSQMGSGHMGHAGPVASATPADTPAVAAYRVALAQMHQDMDIAYSGEPDVDFVRGMIPHHAGAVAMARTVLAFGKDPQIRKLAEEVVKAQEAEIAFMQAWLASHAGGGGAATPAK